MSFIAKAVYNKLSGNKIDYVGIKLILLEACKKGDIDMVKKSLKISKNSAEVVNYRHPSTGFTPLKYACYYGHYEIVSILIKIKGINIDLNGGENIESSSCDFESPLTLAIMQSDTNPTNYIKIIDLLCKKGANINARSEFYLLTPLSASIKYERLQIFKYLISKPKILLNLQSDNKWNVLHFASFYVKKEIEILSTLLELNEYDTFQMINNVTTDNSTPLHLCIKSWPIMTNIQLSKCKLLIKHGADINKKDSSNKTPFDYINDDTIRKSLTQFASKYVDQMDYLILNKNAKSFELINGDKRLQDSDNRFICDYNRHSTEYISSIVHNEIKDKENKGWAYFRDLALKRTQDRLVFDMDTDKWFLFAIYIKENAIDDDLRESLLYNLSLLAQDENVKYDLRDSNSGHYLNPLSFKFDPHRSSIRMEEKDEMYRYTEERVINLYLKQTKYDKYGCMTYTILNDINGKLNKSTAFIHDLIDPNKNLKHHKLWIPTIFDCKYNGDDINKLIKSPILNLDYVKYRNLYKNIGDVFKILIQPSFEKLLGIRLGSNEKVIVKSMKYILQKNGDRYNGCLHREGLGENIIALSVYYPSITGDECMGNGQLTISLMTQNNETFKEQEVFHEFDIKQGSSITFYNEGYHQLKSIQYKDPDNGKKDKGPISRTILAFFLISPVEKERNDIIPASDDKKLNVNISYYWKYYISYWLRNEYGNGNIDNKWMNDLISLFLFGLNENYDRFVYKKRAKMRKEKGRELTYGKRRRFRGFRGGEGVMLNFDFFDRSNLEGTDDSPPSLPQVPIQPIVAPNLPPTRQRLAREGSYRPRRAREGIFRRQLEGTMTPPNLFSFDSYTNSDTLSDDGDYEDY